MRALSRRDFLALAAAAPALPGHAATPKEKDDVHRQLLRLAARQEKQRRERFAAVKTKEELAALRKSLRETFRKLIGGLPGKPGTPPPVRRTATIDADDYTVEKFTYESLPGYYVPALLYRPKKLDAPAPAVLSPCGHSATGKAADAYQILHVNLAKRGFVVLTYDPVGQGERSQFWDAEKKRSRFGLACGEHAVLGNPLYLLGMNLARFRIWDGVRGLDHLASLKDVDAKRLGCVGSSGGGTLTAYITALDERVAAAAICCYITTLPRRMGNRIEADPDADPEQDIFDFVGAGIDHAGLLALCAPRPTLLDTARFDFFPIEGARETFAEAQHLYEVAGAAGKIEIAEAAVKHGLSVPLRAAVYNWFDRWLMGKKDGGAEEIAIKPRPAKELDVCPEGQVNISFRSRPLLSLAREEFEKQSQTPKVALRDLLRLDPDEAEFAAAEIAPGREGATLLLLVNGNETRDWREEKDFLKVLSAAGHAVTVVDPRGVGTLRPDLAVKGHAYADPLVGVEENLAYNAFLVGKTLAGMRTADVLAAVSKLREKTGRKVVLVARRDAALVAVFAAALDPRITALAVEGIPLSFRPLFDPDGRPVNAASIVPGLLRDFGDVTELLAAIAPRKVLAANGTGTLLRRIYSVTLRTAGFTAEPAALVDWLPGAE
jgi:cephalosporin-C deacetylase-like acetyl esterase